MSLEPKTTNRFQDAPRDKPQGERVEHGNLERPGAQFHPRAAGGWRTDSIPAWRTR